MAKVRLTKKVIDGLKTTKQFGEKFFDVDLPCFGINVMPSGRKSFFVKYGSREKRKLYTIGPYGVLTPEVARNKAKAILADTLDGRDPLKERQAPVVTMTFDEWFKIYWELVKLHKKGFREDKRYLGIASKAFGSEDIKTITRDQIETIFNSFIAEGKTAAANRFLASVRACLQEAWRRDYITANPAMKIKPKSEPAARSRVLSTEEYQKLADTVDLIPNPYTKTAFKLLMHTGARVSEVLHAKWEDIDLENALWVIPSPKSGKRQTIPLTDTMVSMLKELPKAGDYVIWGENPDKPRSSNPKSDKPRSDLKRPWNQLKREASLKNITIHDIRRTFGLQITKRDGLHIASKLLRHSDIRVTERHYAPLETDTLRKALVRREKAQKNGKKSE